MEPTKDRDTVVKAIKQLKRQVTQADVCRATGLPLSVVALNLNEIAYESKGRLWVSKDGNLIYGFPFGFERRLRGPRFLSKIAELLWGCVRYLFKVSFGMMLLAPLIVLAFVFLFMEIIMRIFGGDDSSESLAVNFISGILQLTFSSYDVNVGSDKKSINFMLGCYHFLFGAGNPNQDLEERRFKLVAEAIDRNNGVLVSEQLLPFTLFDKDREREELSVLVRFEGVPEVSDSGNIVYTFPKMRHTAIQEKCIKTSVIVQDGSKSGVIPADTKTLSGEPHSSDGDVPGTIDSLNDAQGVGLDYQEPNTVANTISSRDSSRQAEQLALSRSGGIAHSDYLEERFWKFAGIGAGMTVVVLFLAIGNLIGTIHFFHFCVKEWHLFSLPAFYSGMLLGYGIFFLALPLFRIHLNLVRNFLIATRNNKRIKTAQEVASPDANLESVLHDASKFAINKIEFSSSDVAFDTARDSLEQQFPDNVIEHQIGVEKQL
ncbi:MAG: hypothetical protein K2Z81_02440 [Cyanobacteria bacterium]|nr:hypothetical protein [Cyanobacteriota bacterium]